MHVFREFVLDSFEWNDSVWGEERPSWHRHNAEGFIWRITRWSMGSLKLFVHAKLHVCNTRSGSLKSWQKARRQVGQSNIGTLDNITYYEVMNGPKIMRYRCDALRMLHY